MNRDDLRQAAREAALKHAPDLAFGLVERMIESTAVQRWFDGIERRRPRGIVAWVRRMRGKERGITPEQRKLVEDHIRELAERHRR